MNAAEHRELGALAAKVEHLERQVASIQADVRVIRDTMTEVRGRWRMLVALAGFSAAVGALIAKAASWAMPFFQR